MSIKAGLVGLPNVGKSTLFNALTKSSVPAENYPFCTIEPHVAITHVPDERLNKLLQIYDSQKIIPTSVTFVDIAGLVKGAASGEGLGNQFLTHIREVDLILHVLRCFEDPNIIRSNELDPIEDYEIIISELMLKDLESVEKRIEKINRQLKGATAIEKKELLAEFELLNLVNNALQNADEKKVRELINDSKAKTIPLLSAKNYLIIANISETSVEDFKNSQMFENLKNKFSEDRIIIISVKLEGELAQLQEEDANELMTMMGLKERGLDVIINKTYENLGLITFFTCGPKEIHAWPIKKNTTIRNAAGEIHSDLERGFICAEVFNCKDIFEYKSIPKLKDLGKIRTEGQNYIVQDGDIINVRFNV